VRQLADQIWFGSQQRGQVLMHRFQFLVKQLHPIHQPFKEASIRLITMLVGMALRFEPNGLLGEALPYTEKGAQWAQGGRSWLPIRQGTR